MVLLAQLSDLHLDGGERASTRAARTMDYLRGLPRPVDAVLVTGDIADHGESSEYAEAARILEAPFPVFTAPGNHDARSPFRAGLLGEPGDDSPINRMHRVGESAVLMCDSTIPGRDEGDLDEQTLQWMSQTLTELGDTPALLAFHHPPVPVHHPLPDGIRLRNGDELAALLAAHPNVVAVLTGHAHTAAATSFAGKPLLVGPAVTWTLRLPWESDDPADFEQPPALAFHYLDDRGLTTHFRAVI
ncbi:MAG: metallophosphoesterase [Stackebrandtia sp.]